jgi:excisionase family DNA binding protein
MDKPLITAEEMAAFLKVSTKSIYRWASEGRLPAFREGRLIRFLGSDVETFVKSRIGARARGVD